MLGDAAKPWGSLTSSLLSPMPSSPGISTGRRMVEVRAPSTGDESPRSASVESRPLAESGEGAAEADVGEETVAEDSEGEVGSSGSGSGGTSNCSGDELWAEAGDSEYEFEPD